MIRKDPRFGLQDRQGNAIMMPAGNDSENGASQEAASLCASPRIFENPLLDKLSRVHWSTPLFLYVPLVFLLAVLSLKAFDPWAAAGATALGYFIWTLIEYFGHRFLFHYEFPG
ncbi:MAG: hypothetical protein ACLPOA_13960, partial [Methylocella sp.]